MFAVYGDGELELVPELIICNKCEHEKRAHHIDRIKLISFVEYNGEE